MARAYAFASALVGQAKSWVLRYMLEGRAREMGLGSYYDISLAEARDRARSFRRMAKDGIDPIDNRRARRAAQRAERAKVMRSGSALRPSSPRTRPAGETRSMRRNGRRRLRPMPIRISPLCR